MCPGRPNLLLLHMWLPRVHRQKKLTQLRVADMEETLGGPTSRRDMLYVLCVLADWAPPCVAMEAELRKAVYQLGKKAAANKGGGPANRIQLFKVDASECSVLQSRYQFKTVPMFLMYFAGKLVEATNKPRGAAAIVEKVLQALVQGERGQTLPDNFSFHWRGDNTLLDDIQPQMTLLGKT